MRLTLTLRQALLAILAGAAATIGGALFFQHALGYVPCKLCFQQRYPYYAAMVIALVALCLPPRIARYGLGLIALVFLAGAGLGVYHAGVEWGFFVGPNDCGGTPPAAGSMNDFLSQLQNIKVVSCTEAAWRFLGLSLAGWNVLISLGLAGFAAAFADRAFRGYGSSSLSQ